MSENTGVYAYKSIEARKKVPFTEIGNLYKFKVANLDKIVDQIRKERIKAEMDMKIEVKAIQVRRDKDITKIIRFAKDPITSVYYGIMSGELPDGNIKWLGIFLTEINSFDLESDFEAKCFAVLRMHPALRGCPFETTEEPTFEIIDPNQIANDNFKKAMQVEKALGVVKRMRTEHVESFARFMDIPFADGMNARFVKSLLATAAQTSPEALIRNWTDPNRPLFEMISIAKFYGIISFNPDNGHFIGSTGLGYTIYEVAAFLENNTNVIARVRAKLQEQNKDVLSMNEYGKKPEPVLTDNESDGKEEE